METKPKLNPANVCMGVCALSSMREIATNAEIEKTAIINTTGL